MLILLDFSSVSAQAPPPLRDSTYYIDMCGGIDTIWTVPYFEEGVQYRWEPTSGPVQDVASHITPIIAQNLSEDVISYVYYMSRTYQPVPGFYYTLTDTITIRVWPEPSGNLATDNFSLCPGDSAELYFSANVVGSYLSLFPSESTYWDTLVSPAMFLFPEQSTIYNAYFTNPGGCLRGPTNVSVNVGLNPPDFTVDFPNIVCTSSDPIKLFQYVNPPFLGLYSGPGIVNDTIFAPALLSPGAYPITYSLNYLSCVFSLTDTIYVINPGSISMTDIPNFCTTEPRYLLNVGTPPGGEYSGPGVSNGFFTPLDAGVGAHVITYSVSFDEFCVAETSQIVNVIPSPPKPTLTAEPPILALCDGDSVRLTCSFYPNYFWNTTETTQSIVVSEAGIYFVRVANSAGCANFSDTISISESTRPIIDTLYSELYPNGYNLSYYGSLDGRIELEVSGGTLPYSYTWSNGSTEEDQTNLAAGTYSVTVTDSAGCPAIAEISLTRPDTVIAPPPPPGPTEFSLPNAFTPNGDGYNDTYKINQLSPKYTQNTFYVWDISRRLVFRAENYDNTWSGLDNSGKKLPAGTYFAVFESPALSEPVKAFIDLRYE